MDFTINIYQKLLHTLKLQGYQFQTFEKFVGSRNGGKVVVLRHDVDRLPENALLMAELEHQMGLQATYYFRIVPDRKSVV